MSLNAGLKALLGAQWFPYDVNRVPDGSRYAVLWVPEGRLSAEDVAWTPDLLTVIFSVVGVSNSGGEEAVAVAAACRGALVGKTPTATGWSCGLIEQVGDPVGPRRDEDRPDVTVFISSANYQLRATRA